MDYNLYLQEQISLLKKSSLYFQLLSRLSRCHYSLQLNSGEIKDKRSIEYFVNISILNENGDIVEIFDEGFLCAYNAIVIIHGKNIKYSKWDDKDFLESLQWIINCLDY